MTNRPMTIITGTNWYEYKHEFPNFTIDEMASPESGIIRVELQFMISLQGLRRAFGNPMVITSGCRTRAYNTTLQGHRRSLHICDETQHPGQMGAMAVDVAVLDGRVRGRLFALAWNSGWSIGWGGERKFLHLDRRVWVGLRQSTFSY